MIQVNKIIPDVCKHESCLDRATHYFTDLSNDGKLTIGVSGDDGNNMSVETSHVTIGYSCDYHIEKVNKMLKEIYDE